MDNAGINGGMLSPMPGIFLLRMTGRSLLPNARIQPRRAAQGFLAADAVPKMPGGEGRGLGATKTTDFQPFSGENRTI